MPKISIIVPTYNHAPFLARRLDSVFDQTFVDREVIILDDASTDESLDIIDRYLTRPGAKFIGGEGNSGNVFQQWRKGIERASGEYIWIAESDDAASVHFLATLAAALDSDPRIGLAYSQSWLIDREGRILSDARDWTADLHPSRWDQNFVNEGREEIRDYLVHKNTIPNASAVLLRRAAIPDLALTFEAPMRLCGDWLLWVKLLAEWRIAFCAPRLNFWRQDSSNARADLNGLLEAREGQVVIEQACKIIGADEVSSLKYRIAFLERCLLWRESSIESLASAAQGFGDKSRLTGARVLEPPA